MGEGKKVSDDALAYLSKAVDGSFRDGVKILDQVLSNSDSVELADIEKVVSGSAGYKIESLIAALAEKNVTVSLSKLDEAVSNGVDLTYLLVSLMRGLRDLLLAGEIEIGVTKLIFSLDEVARRLATSLDGELLIQVAIVEWCGSALAEKNQAPNNNNQTNNKIAKKDVISSGPVLSDAEGVERSQKTDSSTQVAVTESKSPWQIMKEKLKSGEKIVMDPTPSATSQGHGGDTIEDAMAIFS
jgi:DNA polymerase III gamma/tau subunit